MQINVEILENLTDTVVTIACREQSPLIDRLISALRMVDQQLMVFVHGTALALDLTEILYIETVDKKCFVYTKEQVYESCRRLYELERELAQYLFVRISKSCVANLKNIESVKTYLNHRLLITLTNGEQLVVSRQYADNIKTMLGVK